VSLFLHQLRGEQRLYWRSRELAFFTFLFPIVLFILLGSVYGDDRIKSEHNVKSSAYLLAGVLGRCLLRMIHLEFRVAPRAGARAAASGEPVSATIIRDWRPEAA